jgi:uncharacterized protein DUF1566
MSASSLRFPLGVAGLLAVLASWAPARAAAPAGRYMVSAGTVYDTKTKLTWQQTVSPATYQWNAADNYCYGLGSALPGTGWRVPTIKELQTIVDFTVKMGPYVDQGAFPASSYGSLWSATPTSTTSGNAWLLHDDGTTSNDNVAQSYNVRCVH